jgi:hypothetical protein
MQISFSYLRAESRIEYSYPERLTVLEHVSKLISGAAIQNWRPPQSSNNKLPSLPHR